ncbi:MAG: hypothetical protein LBV47_01375 [Bacteroidales bacterium]|jgi:hypothetical protein|nr:hypothetical protein [Bacteroidales bacterium]
MKKVIIFIVLVAACAAGNAQFFVEGSVGMGRLKDRSDIRPYSTFTVSVSPKAGYWLNNNIAIGAMSFFTGIRSKSMVTDPYDPYNKIDWEQMISQWGLDVFTRYKLWGAEKFSILVDSPVGLRKQNIKEEIGTITHKTQSMSAVGIYVIPAVSYDLTNRFSIIATFNNLCFGASYQTVKNEETGIKGKYSSWGFNTQSSFSSSLSYIQLGFIYNFKKLSK